MQWESNYDETDLVGEIGVFNNWFPLALFFSMFIFMDVCCSDATREFENKPNICLRYIEKKMK